jgi:hypothetical protein
MLRDSKLRIARLSLALRWTTIVTVSLYGLIVAGFRGPRSEALQALAAEAPAAQSNAGMQDRAASISGPIEYVFKNDILTELRRDTDGNGKLDDWRTFDRGYLAHLELDLDQDGEPDWRESWKLPDFIPPVAYELQFIEGRWRILPVTYYIEGNNQHIARGDINSVLFNYTGHAEKLIEGKWTDTFEDIVNYSYHTAGPTDGDLVVKWKWIVEYRNGIPVKGSIHSAKVQHDFEWQNGLALQWVQVVGQQRTVSRYENGVRAYLEYSDSEGQPTHRSHLLTNTEEVFRNGKWTGKDFEENDGWNRTVYKGGHLILNEYINRITGTSRRKQYDPKGNLQSSESTETEKGADYRTINDRSEAKINGVWTGDFERNVTTYRDGRVFRQVFPNTQVVYRRGGGTSYLFAPFDWPTVILTHPTPNEDEWSDGAHTRFWARYDPKNQLLIYEAHDLDGDGKPDLIADYVKLTLIQSEPPIPPK